MSGKIRERIQPSLVKKFLNRRKKQLKTNIREFFDKNQISLRYACCNVLDIPVDLPELGYFKVGVDIIATDTDWNFPQHRLIEEWGSLLGTIYDIKQLPKLQERIPSSWLPIADTPCSHFITELWSGAREVLPRFVDYLSQSTLALAVADGRLGPTLIYHLQDWEETETGQYQDGFMLAGLPTPIELIDAFEHSVGKIPASLHRLWQVHGFLLLKDGAFLSSLDRSLQDFCASPKVLGLRKARYNPKEQYECLAIANVWKELPFCLTRKPSTRFWEDFIVLADRDGEEVSPAGRTCIDDLLTDWTFSRWSP